MNAGLERINQGKPFIIQKVLYSLKSSRAAFHAFLAEILDKIGNQSSYADPNVWSDQ